ncbi:MAG: DUF262 domain-containing protein [Treponemataceae bacterium]
MSDENLLQTVEEVFNKKGYIIPEYQRGYKWTKDNVTKLLDDIETFKSPMRF